MYSEFIRKPHLITYQKMSYVAETEAPSAAVIHVDCSYGTNPFGYSSHVSSSQGELLEGINSYPRYPYLDFRKKLAEYWRDSADLDTDCIRLGTGSMGILNTINRILISEKTHVLGYTPQFTDYITDVCSIGAAYEYVELNSGRNYRFDSAAFLERMDPRHHVIYIDNPNNPTGQVIPIDDIRKIVETAEEMGLCVIVDEAYGDFMSKKNSAIGLTPHFENLFVTRSFSKGFGLAGIRIGYVVCSRYLAPYYQKIDTAFTVSDAGCRIAALALEDEGFIEESIRNVNASKRKLMSACNKLVVWETDMSVPIMVLQHPNETVNLFNEFAERGVLTEAGTGFLGLGKNAVRLRIPTDIDALIPIIKAIDGAV